MSVRFSACWLPCWLLGVLVAVALDAHADESVARTSGVVTVRGEQHTYLTEGSGETCIVVGLAPDVRDARAERAFPDDRAAAAIRCGAGALAEESQ